MSGTDRFDLVRRLDGRRYRFDRTRDDGPRPVYRRADGLVECRCLPGRGWCVTGPDGEPNGWPYVRASGDLPPAGPWRSWKNGTSYLYDLAFPDTVQP